MDRSESFEVLVRHKVPFFTALFFKINLVFAFILLITYLFFLPAEKAPTEMQLAYTNLVIPISIVKIFSISLIGFCVSLYLYLRVGLYKNATLNLSPELININGKKFHFNILPKDVIKISLFDPQDRYGIRKGEFKIAIELKDKKIWLKLKDYDSSDDLMNILIQFSSINIEGLDNNPSLTDEKEDYNEY